MDISSPVTLSLVETDRRLLLQPGEQLQLQGDEMRQKTDRLVAGLEGTEQELEV